MEELGEKETEQEVEKEKEKESESGKESEESVPDRPDYATEIAEVIRSEAPTEQIREQLNDYHENDIADALEELTTEERKRLYAILGAEATCCRTNSGKS